ncbi:MAG: antitoxin VapB family protein [Candidatus Thermoplasmatota archaeon]
MTKVVQLSDAAYDRLKAQKQSGESFSDVVLRSIGRPSLLEAVRQLPKRSKAEHTAHERIRRQMRDLSDEKADRLAEFRRTGQWP